jgi:hypothetical protein
LQFITGLVESSNKPKEPVEVEIVQEAEPQEHAEGEEEEHHEA